MSAWKKQFLNEVTHLQNDDIYFACNYLSTIKAARSAKRPSPVPVEPFCFEFREKSLTFIRQRSENCIFDTSIIREVVGRL